MTTLQDGQAKEKDWCGSDPANAKNWFTRKFLEWMAKKVPDVLEIEGKKIDIGCDCCRPHDEDNSKNGANKTGDENLKECIRKKLEAANITPRNIWFYSNLYYVGVRAGNPFYKSPKELLSDLKKEVKRKFS